MYYLLWVSKVLVTYRGLVREMVDVYYLFLYTRLNYQFIVVIEKFRFIINRFNWNQQVGE